MTRGILRFPLPRAFLVSLVAVAATTLLLPAIAQAHRAPTAQEVKQITQAASFADATPGYQFVRVTGITVSTAGPWATATVALYQKKYPAKPESVADESFVKIKGKWRDTTIIDRSPPKAVASDLGLHAQAAAPAHPRANNSNHTVRMVEIVGGVFMGVMVILLIYAVVRHPDRVLASVDERYARSRVLENLREINRKLDD